MLRLLKPATAYALLPKLSPFSFLLKSSALQLQRLFLTCQAAARAALVITLHTFLFYVSECCFHSPVSLQYLGGIPCAVAVCAASSLTFAAEKHLETWTVSSR